MSASQESIPCSDRARGSRSSSSSNRGRGRSSSKRGGGRRANFGGSLTDNNNNNNNNNNNKNNNNNQTNRSEPSEPSSSHHHPSSSTALIESTPTLVTPTNHDDDHQLPPEAETCLICADPIKLYSVAPCDHRTCHICALRLSVLYKKHQCTICKSHIDRLIFTSSSTKSFSQFKPSDIPYTDKKLLISFETKQALEQTVLLLRFNCPDPNCEVACTGWKDFKFHVKRDHHRLVCQLCITNKNIFAHEHTLHTEQSLIAHQNAEHRLCQYENLLFYSDDELFTHMRDEHEQCHICKASGNEEERWKYYKDYPMLERHFKKHHWLCQDNECLADKFIVFSTEMDFKAHQLDKHANQLSTRQRRQAERVETNFGYDRTQSCRGTTAGGNNINRRAGSGGNKAKSGVNASMGDDAAPCENRDVLGVSQLASRAHVPGAGPANHVSRRAMFGANLTTTTTPSPQGVSADRPRTVTDSRSVEQRHQSYMDKVSSTLNGSEQRITSFRHSVRIFKNGESSARDLISTIHSLVGEMDDCAPLVNGLVDLVEDQDKCKALIDAWNQYRIETTQFPSLTPVSGGGGNTNLQSIKKSSQASSSQVWVNVERAASASSVYGGNKPVVLRQHFPSVSSSSTSWSGSVSIPGSLAHAVAHGSSGGRNGSSVASKWSSSSNGGGGGGGNVFGGGGGVKASTKPFVSKVDSAASSGNLNSIRKASFPALPTNAAKSAMNAHKKGLFSNKLGSSISASTSNSGNVTPTTQVGVGGGSAWIERLGRIDDNNMNTEMRDDFRGDGDVDGDGIGGLEELNRALMVNYEQDVDGRKKDGGKSRKGKGKGVQVLSLGGLHRG